MRYLIGGGMFGLAAFGASADDLDGITGSGKIVVATEAAFKPFEYVENGQIVGFGADLLKEVAGDMGVEVEQLDLPFQGILAGLAAGKYDLAATVTKESAFLSAVSVAELTYAGQVVIAGNFKVFEVWAIIGLLYLLLILALFAMADRIERSFRWANPQRS